MKEKKLDSHSSLLKVSIFVTLVGIITLGCKSFAASNTQQPTPFQSRDNINTKSEDIPVNKGENNSTIYTPNDEMKVSKANSANAAESFGIKQDMPYKEARKILIQQGWQPNLTVDSSELEDRTSKELFELGYKEVKACSGTGMGLCRFEFTNQKGELLVVSARPENGERTVWKWFIEKSTNNAQQSTIKVGTYNLGSRYIVIANQGNRTCYEGISVPSGRYAVAVGETTGSLSQQNDDFVIDGWKKYGRNITLHQHGRKLLITLDDNSLGEYEYFKSGSLGEKYSASLMKCLNSKEVFFETAPGYRITPKSSSSNKIADGFYALGGTGQGLEVKGEQYRYYDEEGQKEWQPISELKYVKEGVVFADKNYWCLSTLAPQNRPGVCTANGWKLI